jgi:hypothetical protein
MMMLSVTFMFTKYEHWQLCFRCPVISGAKFLFNVVIYWCYQHYKINECGAVSGMRIGV